MSQVEERKAQRWDRSPPQGPAAEMRATGDGAGVVAGGDTDIAPKPTLSPSPMWFMIKQKPYSSSAGSSTAEMVGIKLARSRQNREQLEKKVGGRCPGTCFDSPRRPYIETRSLKVIFL